MCVDRGKGKDPLTTREKVRPRGPPEGLLELSLQ